MSKGGYAIIDFKDKELSVGSNTNVIDEVKLIEEAFKNGKPIIMSNFKIDGKKYINVYADFSGSNGLAKYTRIEDNVYTSFVVNSTQHYLTISTGTLTKS
ncbi:MAG: hypothetical protein J6A25_02870 [Lachnospiraceae bacterium]|nr:hypothetical protein [Lachnospiraceae bacterium]